MNRSRTVVFAVIVSTFFSGFGGGVVFPILPNLGKILGISSFYVGLILSANRITRVVANAPAGSLVDRIGTRTPFVAGLAIESLATALYVVAMQTAAPHLWFLLARVVWGLGSALEFATAYTIAANVSDEGGLGTSMGSVRAGITFGFPAGLFLGGVVSELHSATVAFLLATALALVGTGVAYRVIPETHVEDRATRAVGVLDVDRSVPTVTAGVVNFGLFFVYVGVLFTTLVLFLEANEIRVLGFPARGGSGILLALTVLSGSVSMVIGGRLSDRFGTRVPVLFVALCATSLGFLMLGNVVSIGGALLGCLLIGCGQGGTAAPLVALIADFVPEQRMGRAMGTNNLLGDVGGALGPLVSLPLVRVTSFTTVYELAAAVPLLSAAALLVGVRVQRRQEGGEHSTGVVSDERDS